MQSTTRSAITLFAALYLLALLSGSPSATRAWQKIFQKNLPTVSISVVPVRRTSRAAETVIRISLTDDTKERTMLQINTYLNFPGTCKEAFEFYARVLNGKIEAMMTHDEVPASAGMPDMGAEWRSKILHARLSVGNNVLMASDVPPGRFEPARSFSVNIGLTDATEAERIFTALSEDGRTIMPLQQTFWAHRFGMCFDRFGTPWMINCEQPAA
jgi:PhnB protein